MQRLLPGIYRFLQKAMGKIRGQWSQKGNCFGVGHSRTLRREIEMEIPGKAVFGFNESKKIK